MQAKCRMKRAGILRAVTPRAQLGPAASSTHRLLEAAAGEPAGGRRPGAPAGGRARRARSRSGSSRRERVRDALRRASPSVLQVEADGGVPVAALRERRAPAPSAARSSSTRPLRSSAASAVRAGVGRDAALREPLVEPLREQVAVPERRHARRRAPAPAAARARASRAVATVERRARRRSPLRTTASAGIVRQGAPSSSTSTRPRGRSRSAVTVFRDSVREGRRLDARPPPQPRRRSGFPFEVATSASTVGSRRAETICSGPDLELEPLEDLLRDVRVLAQERGRVLPALAEPLVAEAEVRARLRDDLPFEPRVEHGALPRDARCRR